MKPFMRGLARLLTAALVGVCGSACQLDTLVFGGEAVHAYVLPPHGIPDSLLHEVSFPSGTDTLHGYWLRQPGAAPRFTVIFSHGKGGNLAHATEWSHAEALWHAGFDVLTYDYRGFGRSTGTSTDGQTLAADAAAALTFAQTRPNVVGPTTISYGHSLGSVAAIALAATHPDLRALVVEAGFADGNQMAETADPLGIPATWLLRDPMINTRVLQVVRVPVLILHGVDDRQIPLAQGKALFEAANHPKQFVSVPHAGHDNIPEVMGAGAYRILIRGFTGAPPEQ